MGTNAEHSALLQSLGVETGSLDPEAVVGNAWGHLVAALGTAGKYPGRHKGPVWHQPRDSRSVHLWLAEARPFPMVTRCLHSATNIHLRCLLLLILV